MEKKVGMKCKEKDREGVQFRIEIYAKYVMIKFYGTFT